MSDRFTYYVDVNQNMSRRFIDADGEYLKKIPSDYRGIKDLVYTFDGHFQTMITLSFSDELLEDMNAINDLVTKYLSTFQKYSKTQGEHHYIGILEHGESKREKNPIAPHYHVLTTCKILKKKGLFWKKSFKRKGVKLWFDKIICEKTMRNYVAKYAKGSTPVKDYQNPACEEWKDLLEVRRNITYTQNLKNDVSFRVENKLLSLLRLGKIRYLYNYMLRTKIEWDLRNDEIVTYYLDDIDWTKYEDVELNYILKKLLISDFCKGKVFDNQYFDNLMSIFSIESNVIDIYRNTFLLDSVAHLSNKAGTWKIQLAHDEILRGFKNIPKRYKWNFVFSFREWENITNSFYWEHKMQGPLTTVETDLDEELEVLLDANEELKALLEANEGDDEVLTDLLPTDNFDEEEESFLADLLDEDDMEIPNLLKEIEEKQNKV